jgi:general secretion pathway protein L
MSLSRITENVSRGIDVVAETVVHAMGIFQPARCMRLIEEDIDVFFIRSEGTDAKVDSNVAPVRLLDDGVSAALKSELAGMLHGSEVEIVLQPRRFLIRPLELPKRASEFLDGIVRSQIDRLTPWRAADAVFGWTQPIDAPDDRISLTVVATARAKIEPYVQALTALGVNSVVVSMRPEDEAAGAVPVRVFAQSSQSVFDVARARHWLMVILAVASVATAVATVTAQFVGDGIDAQTRDVNRQITERRAALVRGRNAADGAPSAQRALERRKQESAASVIVLDALSHVLPDHTYMTELRIEADKVQIIGVSREASSLIRLMEDSPHFTRATFFAPTTRSPGDPGERFHIEARIKPVFVTSQ